MDRAAWCQGTPISLQSMFVLPFTHFGSPRFLNGGAMVPIHKPEERYIGASGHWTICATLAVPLPSSFLVVDILAGSEVERAWLPGGAHPRSGRQ